MNKSAIISDCGKYRYWLEREWDDQIEKVAFVGLNPSTADAENDDPTIRRCINYAKAWGYGALVMVNVFAWRATKPEDMLAAGNDAEGVDNSHYLSMALNQSAMTVAAWGGNCTGHEIADKFLMAYGYRLHALKLNKDGSPAHPLYLKKTLKPVLLSELKRERQK